jgi:predicted Rdx family selenoprotein
MNALAKSEGGMDKAKALRKEWNDTVENELDNIGHVHKPK